MLVCCLYCLLGRNVVARAQHSCRGASLPTKTAWGKCKGEPAALGTPPGDMQLHHDMREVRLGACARRSHTREFNAHPGGCHQWRAMTGCPQLRLDESVVAKPIPAILCCPDWDDAKGVKATAEVTMWCTEEHRALRQAPLRQCASPPCSTSSMAARVDRTRTPPSPSPTAMIARLLLGGDGKNQQSQPASVPPDSGHLSCAG
jgi:hypothetical protein